MTKNKILRYALGPIGSAALGFITLPLMTWFYSIEDIGRISMLQVVASFSILLFCLGLDQAYVREYHESENTAKLLKLSILPGLALLTVFYSILFLINPPLIADYLYEIPSSTLALISVICFVCSFISRFLSLIVRMEERALAFSMSQLLPRLLFLLFIIASIWLGFKKDTFNLITAHILSVTTILFVFAWNTRQELLKAIKVNISIQEFTPLLKFGLPLVIGGLASWGLNVMDKLFLRNMSSFAELGIYSVAVNIASAATIFAGIFNTIWAPLVYRWIKEGADLTIIEQISEHLLAAIYFTIVLSGLFSWILVFFLPKEYASIQYLITACLIAPLLYTLSETSSVGIAITRKTKFSMYASLGAVLVNIIGNYLLVPCLGASGAAVSTAFSFWVFYILRTEYSNYIWKKTPRKKNYLTTSFLLIITITNALYFKGNTVALIIWFILLILGSKLFWSSIKTANKTFFKIHL